MKKSELRQIIKEEISKIVNEKKNSTISKSPNSIKNIQRIISDISKKKIILSKSKIYFDDKDPFYFSLEKYTEGGDEIECLNRIPNMSPYLYPISENSKITPSKIDLLNLYKIISGMSSLIPLRQCADYMNDEDGQYILLEYKGGQGYISQGDVGDGLQKGTDYDLGMGFILTSIDFN